MTGADSVDTLPHLGGKGWQGPVLLEPPPSDFVLLLTLRGTCNVLVLLIKYICVF